MAGFCQNKDKHKTKHDTSSTFRKIRKMHFFIQKCLNRKTNGTIRKCPLKASNEWSSEYISTILKSFGQFLCPTLGDRSHHQSLKSNPLGPTQPYPTSFLESPNMAVTGQRQLLFSLHYRLNLGLPSAHGIGKDWPVPVI
jgi:hypothetical protein